MSERLTERCMLVADDLSCAVGGCGVEVLLGLDRRIAQKGDWVHSPTGPGAASSYLLHSGGWTW